MLLNKYVFFENVICALVLCVGTTILWNSWCRLINFTITAVGCSLCNGCMTFKVLLGRRNGINNKKQFNNLEKTFHRTLIKYSKQSHKFELQFISIKYEVECQNKRRTMPYIASKIQYQKNEIGILWIWSDLGVRHLF